MRGCDSAARLVPAPARPDAAQSSLRVRSASLCGDVPFLASLKQRRDVELIPLTVSNREAVQEELVERLGMLCLEDEPARALERQADRICQMIVAGDAPQLDIEIQQAALRDAVSRRFPEKPALYPLAYETRFRRVWQQFRHQGHG